jgi:3-hydroxyisobutyrate dehydrogenase-like beta-hydroxyacid dehydrogenase
MPGKLILTTLLFCILFSSGIKMVNQLLAGVHIASGAEAMAFGARLGINTRMLFDFITNSRGTSWYVSSSLLKNETNLWNAKSSLRFSIFNHCVFSCIRLWSLSS